MYKSIKITHGSSGWGGPLVVQPTEKKNKVLCVTGNDVHPIAKKIAEMTGCELVNGFVTGCPDDEVAIAVVDCGGTARCGVYPKKKILTVNVMPVGAVGPLAKFITEDLYVSDVKEANLTFADESDVAAAAAQPKEEPASANTMKSKAQAREELAKMNEGKKENVITKVGKAVGIIVGKFFAAGRETIDMVIKNILPFMAFTATLMGIISASGLGNIIANTISPMCSTLPGMLIISVVCAIPFISPILGPGAVIASVVGVLIGQQIGAGAIPPQYALPALFATNAQVGCDFVPVGLSLMEAEPATIEEGVPAVLFSRLITGPIAVLIAFAFSIGMY